MKKLELKLFIFTALFFGAAFSTQAAEPVLNFSDLINGPKTGLGDGLGEGAIVTIWGTGLGATQGLSTITYTDSLGVVRNMAHVYYWENADAENGDSGPAELYKYHKMQTVAFSIPASSADGAGTIKVTVDGQTSNPLPFYARSNGVFYFVDMAGSNANDGTWGSPKLTLTDLTRNDSGLAGGDVIYVTGEYTIMGNDGLFYGNSGSPISGSDNNNIALTVYPGNSLTITTPGTGLRGAISNYSSKNDYWVFSKITGKSEWGGISGSAKGRIIANEFTGNGFQPKGSGALIDCGADFELETIGGNNIDDVKVFGNYLHHFGTPASNNNLLHTMYFRIRSDTNYLLAPEIAWNYLHDPQGPRFGIHYYDEGDNGEGRPCVGTFASTMKIHDNVVEDQTGPGINIGTLNSGTHIATFNTEIYNNLLINCGRDTVIGGNTTAIQIYGSRMQGHFKIYNNTVYGYGEPTDDGFAINIPLVASNSGEFGGTYELHNNIFVDTNDYPFQETTMKPPVSSNHNIWYSASGQMPPPTDTTPITLDPLFTNTGVNDFSLTSASPARNAGIFTTMFNKDIFSLSRPQGSAYDIGAYEYEESGVVIRADVDQNSSINSTDALLTLRNSLGLNMSSTNWQASATTGDVNCDDSSNSIDALLILRESLGLDMSGTGWCW